MNNINNIANETIINDASQKGVNFRVLKSVVCHTGLTVLIQGNMNELFSIQTKVGTIVYISNIPVLSYISLMISK